MTIACIRAGRVWGLSWFTLFITGLGSSRGATYKLLSFWRLSWIICRFDALPGHGDDDVFFLAFYQVVGGVVRSTLTRAHFPRADVRGSSKDKGLAARSFARTNRIKVHVYRVLLRDEAATWVP